MTTQSKSSCFDKYLHPTDSNAGPLEDIEDWHLFIEMCREEQEQKAHHPHTLQAMRGNGSGFLG